MNSRSPRVLTAEARAHLGQSAHRELVLLDSESSLRWNVHGWPDPVARWNYHPELEVHLLQHGSGRYVVGDHIGAYEPGQLVLVGSNVPHNWISDAPAGTSIPERDVVLQFHPDTIQQWMNIMPEVRALVPILKAARRGIEFRGACAKSGTRILLSMREMSGLDRVRELIRLLQVLQDGLDDAEVLASPAMLPSLSQDTPDVIEYVIREIYCRVDDDVRIGEIAAHVGMSPSTLSRHFKRMTGQTIRDTLRRLRLIRACQLLDGTDLSVARIASKSGYRNLSNFNRQFYRDIGMTPREYRSRTKNSSAAHVPGWFLRSPERNYDDVYPG